MIGLGFAWGGGGENASHDVESTRTCIPYLRPACLAYAQLKNLLFSLRLKCAQLPHHVELVTISPRATDF